MHLKNNPINFVNSLSQSNNFHFLIFSLPQLLVQSVGHCFGGNLYSHVHVFLYYFVDFDFFIPRVNIQSFNKNIIFVMNGGKIGQNLHIRGFFCTFSNSTIILLIWLNGIINQLTFRKLKEMETPFIKKVKKILEDSENVDIICWNQNKTMIEIRNQKFFEQRVLSRHFRHSRISSFIRQLNLYGFKKIRSAEHRTFTHPLLQKGLGLEAIINKKKKIEKNDDQNIANDSINIEVPAQRKVFENEENIRKQIGSDYRISQNLIFNRELEKEDKTIIATTNTITTSEQCLNTVWFVPFQTLQQNMWKMPLFKPQQGMCMNLNYNLFQNWL